MAALSSGVQELLVSLLCYDDQPGGAQTFAGLIEPKQYDPYYREIAREAITFIKSYDKPPGDHTIDIFDQLSARHPDDAEIYNRIYASIQESREGINRQWVLDQAQVFSRNQRLKAGMSQAIDALKAGGVDEAEKILRDAMEASSALFDAGTVVGDPKRTLRFLDTDYRSMPCGIPQLDRVGLGPARKRLHILAARPGRGKSQWLIHLAKVLLINRFRVLFVSLELGEEEVCQRILQATFAMSKRSEEIKYVRFRRNEAGTVSDFDINKISDRPALSDRDVRGYLEEGLKRFHSKPPLIVKEFPTASLSVDELSSYLDSLVGSMRFLPDVVLIDYADLLSTDTSNYRISLGHVYKKLRGLAGSRNIAIATASQLNRNAENKKMAGLQDLSEDDSKGQTADVVITYNQTEAEHELGLARLYVAKGRTDRDKFTVLIAQSYATGQFVIDSAAIASSYWNHLSTHTNGKATEDHQRDKKRKVSKRRSD